MTQFEFEENESEKISNMYSPQTSDKPRYISLIFKLHITKDENKAKIIVLCTVAIFIIISVILFIQSQQEVAIKTIQAF